MPKIFAVKFKLKNQIAMTLDDALRLIDKYPNCYKEFEVQKVDNFEEIKKINKLFNRKKL